MFAVNRVGIVQNQPAMLAWLAYLRWPEKGRGEPKEKRNPDNHHRHGQQAPGCPLKRDVAEPRGRQCRDGEIQRVGVVSDLRVPTVLGA